MYWLNLTLFSSELERKYDIAQRLRFGLSGQSLEDKHLMFTFIVYFDFALSF